MPGMVAFGRRWLLGTDDLFLVGAFDVLCYSPIMIFSCVETYNWFSNDERHFCDNSLFLDIGVSAFLANMAGASLLAIAFLYFSRRGTIFQVEARSTSAALFHIKTICIFLNLLILGFTGYVIHVGDFCNDSSIKLTLLVATVIQSLCAVGQLMFWWIMFDDEGRLWTNKTKKKSTEINIFLGSIPRSAIKKWKLRLLTFFVWFTAPSKGKRDAINTISEILAYISHEMDIVFTDFVAGVLWMRQKHLKYYEKEQLRIDQSPAITLPDGSSVDCFPTTDMPSWMNLHLAKRYFHIGIGVFGWRWTIYRNIACGLCALWNHLMCCFQCRKKSVVEGDNCCGCNIAGLLINSDVPYKDLIHVSFRNKVYVLPFFVSVDAHTMSVVISVRGTMSFNDVLTDLAAGFAPMEDSGYRKDIFCHAGMLKAARRIRDKLDDRAILEAAFHGRDGYQLITTGHSLGASVAAILAFLLRPAYPTVRCFAFEPPPCVTINALETTFDFVFSLVFGNDVVPYLSFKNVEHMIEEVVKCAEECNLPKYKVLFWPLPEYDEGSTQDESEDKMIAPNNTRMSERETDQSAEEESAETENPVKLKEVKLDDSKADDAKQSNGKSKSSLQQSKKTDLYIPGRVLHIRYSKNGYRLQIRTAQDFHPLMIRPDMVIHHFPQYIEGCLEQLGHTYALLSVSS